MSKALGRREQTFLYLLGATIIGLLVAYTSEAAIFMAPILFGLGLSFSNSEHLKSRWSFLLIPICFFCIFTWATLPITVLGTDLYTLMAEHSIFLFGEEVGETNIMGRLFGCLSAFLMVTGIVLATLRETQFGWTHMALILVFSFVAVILLSYTISGSLHDVSYTDDPNAFLKTILIYQVFMSVIITLIIRQVPYSLQSTAVV